MLTNQLFLNAVLPTVFFYPHFSEGSDPSSANIIAYTSNVKAFFPLTRWNRLQQHDFLSSCNKQSKARMVFCQSDNQLSCVLQNSAGQLDQ